MKKIIISMISAIILMFIVPILLALGMIYVPLIDNAEGDANGWLGFWGSFFGGIIGTGGVIFVAYFQHKEQKDFLEKQLKAEKEENDRFLHMEKLKKEIDIANIYLEKLIVYYDNYGNLYEKSNEKMNELQYMEQDKYRLESDFNTKDTIAYELKKDYDQLVFKYNSLKTIITNLNDTFYIEKLDENYLLPLETIRVEEYKRDYKASLKPHTDIPKILDEYMYDLSMHYDDILTHVKKLNDKYEKI
ncbi:hypothetical protein CPZ17_09675 [Staphylococcus epidermidis]|uniref:hypothetical protein n=1 Tax=Staphylococcus epidermidis TaxID=1282 RepID=UPI000C16CF82|nr:hypothetical protein [Staphylococcus epidermidis]ATQ50699.1 hypothetical protein CPZ17_09675 [Staphylococcus epidermidis]